MVKSKAFRTQPSTTSASKIKKNKCTAPPKKKQVVLPPWITGRKSLKSALVVDATDSTNTAAAVKPEVTAAVSSNWKAIKAVADPNPNPGKRRRTGGKGEQRSAQVDPSEVWFDGVDLEAVAEVRGEKIQGGKGGGTVSAKYREDLARPTLGASKKSILKSGNNSGHTRYVAIDCEMVGTGIDGKDSVLARVSIVNRFGHLLMDTFVKPRDPVTDYRTHVSGIRPEDIRDAPEFNKVVKDVAKLLRGKVLVGHAVANDLEMLLLGHPKRDIRDTSKYKPFRAYTKGRTPGLRRLSKEILGIEIQDGEHSSVEDAQATMAIYCKHRADWESSLREKKSSVYRGESKGQKDPAKRKSK